MPSTISAGTTAGTAISVTGDTTGNLAFQTNGTTTAMTIDTSQRVGIGTSSPGYPLTVVSASSSVGLAINGRSSDSVAGAFWFANDGSTQYGTITASATEYRISAIPAAAVQTFYTNSAERMRIDSSGNLLFNSGYGSVATAYGCRAWVNFNGQSTPAIRASGNVSSITDNGTGDYTVNFTTAMTDTNFSAVCSGSRNGGANDNFGIQLQTISSSSNVRVNSFAPTVGFVDPPLFCVAVFR
jgi:hypothetical protein